MCDLSILFLSQMHCTGEHGKAAAWYRANMGIDAESLSIGPNSYMNYPNDWGYNVSKRTVRKLLPKFDAVVIEEGMPDWFGLKDSDLEGKIVVRDAHGTVTRRLWNEFKRSWHGPTIYRTPDLKQYIEGESFYSPCTIDLGSYPHYAVALGNPEFVLAHAPSSERVKGSGMLADALSRLDLKALWVTGEPNPICLYNRRKATVYFDNIADGSYYGYRGVLGVAGIEAAAMGQVVIGDFSAHRGHDALPDFGTTIKTLEELMEVIVILARDKKKREELQSVWCAWVRAARDRNKESRRLLEWLMKQSPYSSA